MTFAVNRQEIVVITRFVTFYLLKKLEQACGIFMRAFFTLTYSKKSNKGSSPPCT